MLASYIYRHFAGDMRVTIVPAFYCFDREYGYSSAQENVNPFSTVKFTAQTEGIHPSSTEGMKQLGAICYWYLLSLFA